MKRLLALFLTLCMTSSVIFPAAAAGTDLNSRMEQATISAKKTLGIGNDYKEFSGNLMENTNSKLWSLHWSKEDSSLEVITTETGRISSYFLTFKDRPLSPQAQTIKKIPKLSQAEAQKIIKDFLSHVLDNRIESFELQQSENIWFSLNNGTCSYIGSLKLNGLSTPVYLSIDIDPVRKIVTNFYRGDEGKEYSTFASTAKVSKEEAAKTLFSKVKMELTYVNSEKDPQNAVLQYLPKTDFEGKYMVDALTGKLVKVEYPIIYGSTSLNKEKADNGGGLTEIERKTVDQLKGALSKEALEAAARKISEMRLTSDYKMNNLNYYVQKEDKDTTILVSMNFRKESGTPEKGNYAFDEKTITLNATTGKFINSYAAFAGSYENPKVNYSKEQCEKQARAFAEKYSAEEIKETKVTMGSSNDCDQYQTVTFTRQVNGIPYLDNCISISVNRTTGAIGSYNLTWSKNINFKDPKGIKTEQNAMAIYTKEAGISLCYENVSVDTNKQEMKLVYDIANPQVLGVEAATGKVLKIDADKKAFAYNDLDGHYAKKQIEVLADYGVGFINGSFKPDQFLTQKDALTLIISATGNYLPQDDPFFEDNLYNIAYSMGILTVIEKKPDAPISRAQATKMIIDATVYGEAAKLQGIYRIGFADEKTIPFNLTGYVAMAKGLGMIEGDTKGIFSPNKTATRAQLAVMLYNVMSR